MKNSLDSIKQLEHGSDDYETRNLIIDKINELIYVINQYSDIIKELSNSKCVNSVKYVNSTKINEIDVSDYESEFTKPAF